MTVFRALAMTAAASAALLAASAGPAAAWGAMGHRIVGRLAAEALPPEVPLFLRTPAAVQAVGELAREPDRSKGAGRAHDADLDPGHILDLGDDGKVFGGPTLAALPPTRAEYETQLRAVGSDSWRAGYLPYSIVESWQQLAQDLAYWRADQAAAKLTTDPAHRAWFQADAAEREQLTLRDLGMLAHFVGDGSQPLHITIHYNGWGQFPNPEGFTQDRVHSPFESHFVQQFVSEAAVRAKLAPMSDCHCPIEQREAAYLATTATQVVPLYQLYRAGGFADADPRGVNFAATRLAAGAAELRDLIVLAWRASGDGQVGWHPVKVSDIEAGRIDPYDAMIGVE